MNITMIVFLLTGLTILALYLPLNSRSITLSLYGRLLLGVTGVGVGVSLVPLFGHITHVPLPVMVVRVCGSFLLLTLAAVSESVETDRPSATVVKVASIFLIPVLILTIFC